MAWEQSIAYLSVIDLERGVFPVGISQKITPRNEILSEGAARGIFHSEGNEINPRGYFTRFSIGQFEFEV